VIRAVLLLSLMAGALILFAPLDRRLVADVYLLALGGLLLLAALRSTGGWRRESAFDRALAPRHRQHVRPAELVRLEDQVLVATAVAGDLHFRLRPALAEIAAHRLQVGHGVRPERDPARARTLLGPEAWELLRPDVEPPADRLGPGMPVERLARIVTALEEV
jgi:hypothetical protein